MVHAFVRRPSSRLADGLVTHQDRVPIDVDLAVDQWHSYVRCLTNAGWTTSEVEPADNCPDSVFVEDAVVMFGDFAVLARPGADSRRDEVVGAEQAVVGRARGVARIVAPGTLDGGDVLKVGSVAYVGLGGRTNEAGIDQLTALLYPHGWNVVAVPVTKVLHLKSAVTALPDGTVVGYEPFVDDATVFPAFLAVPEPSGSHVVVLDEHAVLMAADAPETAAMFRSRGLQVVEVDISEFEKLEGCVTCLSVRLRDG